MEIHNPLPEIPELVNPKDPCDTELRMKDLTETENNHD